MGRRTVKKRIVIILVLLIVLFTPIPSGMYKDGGTKAYSALTYKVIKWKVISVHEPTYKNTSVYLFPNNFKSMNQLWEMEQGN